MSDGKWNVWWWPVGTGDHDYDPPVPYSRTFSFFADAANQTIALAHDGNEWVKMFGRSEFDVRARWDPANGWRDTSRAFDAFLPFAARSTHTEREER